MLVRLDDSTPDGLRIWLRTTSDGINFTSPREISIQGAPVNANCDFAQDWSTHSWYAVVPDGQRSGDREHFSMSLYPMPNDHSDAGNGVWQRLRILVTTLTAYYLID